jgi:hypothetical protein
MIKTMLLYQIHLFSNSAHGPEVVVHLPRNEKCYTVEYDVKVLIAALAMRNRIQSSTM